MSVVVYALRTPVAAAGFNSAIAIASDEFRTQILALLGASLLSLSLAY